MSLKDITKFLINNALARRADVIIAKGVDIRHCNFFEGKNRIEKGTIVSNSKVGIGSYMGSNCRFDRAIIGRYSSIGDNVRVVSAMHPTEKMVSTHPAFFSTRRQAGFSYVDNDKYSEFRKLTSDVSVQIGNDVWICDNVTLLGGIKVGDGAIIGTGAVVTKNIPAYAIAVGVPAKVIKYRFSEAEIKTLLEMRWWDREEAWIKSHISDFEDIKLFCNLEN